MIIIDKEQGLATDIGEYWTKNASNPKAVILEMYLNDKAQIEFSHSSTILAVPLDRLKRLLSE